MVAKKKKKKKKKTLGMTNAMNAMEEPPLNGQKYSLRKQAYSNILKMLLTKNENFQIKILMFYYISAQNID